MLSIGRTSSYAVAALSQLARRSDDWVLVSEISTAIGAPRPYLSKILHALSRAGLITAKRGYKGGYALARPATDISILQIIESVEGPDNRCDCLLGRDTCSDERACPTHAFWQVERERIINRLAGLTLDAVADFERRRDAERPGTRPLTGTAGRPTIRSASKGTVDPPRLGKGRVRGSRRGAKK
ncbi:MAG: Rrf2 family transcriptional regulator [Phycisphaerales bacterium]|nr:Rrf2 family transcriptional regulator [Phycisphaerales bacterium]